ncbi:Uncharacterized protein TCM_046047 [Theobroma cacao]|uniref:Cc-nbs-lrr resistance protein n=1 Tax=Theobroma cacao TaxID=3641 RepID=S1RU01_THECC|nr:Uncharacterized protein TCM_046047 [Theobroma cacao]
MQDHFFFRNFKLAQCTKEKENFGQASFCLGDHNFNFPALQKVMVRQCPQLKIFCQGDLSTPKLKQVQLTEDAREGRWEGDLKTTVKQLFEEMNVQNSEMTEVTL